MFALILLVAFLAIHVAAHGYVAFVSLDHHVYEGFRNHNPNPNPGAIGFSFTTPDEGPELDIANPDFVCRQNAQAPSVYGKVSAGGNVDVQWTSADLERNPNGWAHSGPIITYIANCDGDCTTADKTKLRWTKIHESGLISGPASSQGIWATDVMRENMGWVGFTIPASIAPGNYVIRNELLGLHRSHLMEPEYYPGCVAIEVTGNGTGDLLDKGVIASELYSTEDVQLYGFDFHNGEREKVWPLPGPTLYQDTGRGNETTGRTPKYRSRPSRNSTTPGVSVGY
ncbi:glycosyl hydrolase family 61-domain-containing protein [Plectosphaerella plurivora]|uniref:lytic cellulose monooxygenase (C4-dehydrogenating) n=1 Tax=Plectosphaerella plurivora TaxID=936078 RepID=A0A9P8VMI3_9PEZI|nr:glycosyl hydrolase family 61-domain-containing protein [Plectosphaerella plurivora]